MLKLGTHPSATLQNSARAQVCDDGLKGGFHLLFLPSGSQGIRQDRVEQATIGAGLGSFGRSQGLPTVVTRSTAPGHVFKFTR
jgi:hypothetical protein